MHICGKEIRIEGNLIRVARIAEGFEQVGDPNELVSALQKSGHRVDLLTFMQALSERLPKYDFFMEWDNFAAMPVETFDQWFTKRVDTKIRNKLRKAEKVGVQVREVPFDDALIAGIAAINTLAHIGTSGATWLLGFIKDQTGSYPLALLPLAFLTGMGCVIVLLMGRSQRRDTQIGALATTH